MYTTYSFTSQALRCKVRTFLQSAPLLYNASKCPLHSLEVQLFGCIIVFHPFLIISLTHSSSKENLLSFAFDNIFLWLSLGMEPRRNCVAWLYQPKYYYLLAKSAEAPAWGYTIRWSLDCELSSIIFRQVLPMRESDTKLCVCLLLNHDVASKLVS